MNHTKTVPEMRLAESIGERVLLGLPEVNVCPGVVLDALMSVTIAIATAADLDEEVIAAEWLALVRERKEMKREQE